MNQLDVLQSVRVKIHLEPHELTKNYITKIHDKVIREYGNKCFRNGYVRGSTINITRIENGRRDGAHLHGFMTFVVDFTAYFCIPRKGVTISCYTKINNKFGIMAYLDPIKVMVPRHLQQLYGNQKVFETVTEGTVISVELLGYTIDCGQITAVGHITRIGDPPPMLPLPATREAELPPFSIIYSHETPIPDPRLGNVDTLIERKKQITPFDAFWVRIRDLISPHEMVSIYRHPTVINYNSTTLYSETAIFPTFSRAYFKLWEVLKENPLVFPEETDGINIANIAEGPGGFIQCLIDYRNHMKKRLYTDDHYHAITIRRQRQTAYDNAADWEIANNPSGMSYFDRARKEGYKIDLSYGIDGGDGNLTKTENIRAFTQQIGSNKCHLITADGGILLEGNTEYALQEILNSSLFFAEIVTALMNQNKGGTFILKIYDTYYQITVQLIYLLSIYYQEIKLFKPLTSRPANSEKYLICSGFMGITEDVIENMLKTLEDWVKQSDHVISIFGQTGPLGLMGDEVPLLNELLTFNNYRIGAQIDKIDEGVRLCVNGVHTRLSGKTIDPVVGKYHDIQAKNSVEWCKKYGLPIAPKYT
jgi:23S rRNA U2552 (ribose-2'-O)-methylase RlmE/FtsJ